jgi:uncharacterized Zn-binding protein involved in type VI secretion
MSAAGLDPAVRTQYSGGSMAARPFIVLGDQTDHGGVVIEASVMTDTHGKGIARVGDQVTCPKRNHGTTVIVSGDPTMIIDGKAAARHGDKCACGATLISSQFVSTVGEGGGGTRMSATAFSSHDEPHDVLVGSTARQFDDRFILLDEDSGKPLSNTEYAIKRASGALEFGTTDGHGQTHLLTSTVSAESIDIYA